jgi:hypothetical protein
MAVKPTFLFAGLLFGVAPCLAAPPPGTDLDSPTHTWFERQHSITGGWCCNLADGHILADTDWRIVADHYDVWIDGAWHPVPANAMRDPNGGPNPTGHAVAWWVKTGREIVILCFAPGNEL